MKKSNRILFCLSLLSSCYLVIFAIQPIYAQNAIFAPMSPNSGQALSTGLFALREMDLHVHAGMEREVPMQEWIDLSIKDGRKVLLILDHLELYRMDANKLAEWVQKNNHKGWYLPGQAGHIALMKDFAEVQKRDDIICFRGWEIYEGELDEGLEPEPMKMAEVLGWHISPNHGNTAPNGQTLLKRARQLIALQEQFPVPMILFHPFTSRIGNLQRTAQSAGRDVSSITAAEYQFFQPGEQAELIDLLRGRSIYIEVPNGLTGYWKNDLIRQTAIQDIRPLVEGGVKFTVSTDAHGVRTFDKPFNPELYCNDLGINPENTNAIVRELLAIRARNTLKSRLTNN